MPSIGTKAIRGGLWVAIAQVFTRVLTFTSTVILARLLSPSDYGLVGMVTVVSGIIALVGNIGISSALTQTHDDAHRLAHSAFWMNMGLATLLMVIQLIMAPFVAEFYHMPSVCLVMQVMALGYILQGLSTVHNTLLARELRFRKQTGIEITCGIIAATVSIWMAYSGFGAWSLILPNLIVAPIRAIFIWKIVSWRPKFFLSMKDCKMIFHFGRNVLFTDLLRYFGNNLDYLLIGRFFGAAPLGIYTFAYNQSMYGTTIIGGVVGQILFPAYAELQRQGISHEFAHRRATGIVSLLAFPLQFGQLVLANIYIPLLFGEQWLPAILLFQIMLAYGFVRSVATLGGSALYAAGKPKLELRWNLISAPTMIIAIYVGSYYDILGVAIATGCFGSLLAFVFIIYTCYCLKWGFFSLISTFIPSIVSGVAMIAALLVYLDNFKMFYTSDIMLLMIMVFIGASVYLLNLFLFFPETIVEVFRLMQHSNPDLVLNSRNTIIKNLRKIARVNVF